MLQSWYCILATSTDSNLARPRSQLCIAGWPFANLVVILQGSGAQPEDWHGWMSCIRVGQKISRTINIYPYQQVDAASYKLGLCWTTYIQLKCSVSTENGIQIFQGGDPSSRLSHRHVWCLIPKMKFWLCAWWKNKNNNKKIPHRQPGSMHGSSFPLSPFELARVVRPN